MTLKVSCQKSVKISVQITETGHVKIVKYRTMSDFIPGIMYYNTCHMCQVFRTCCRPVVYRYKLISSFRICFIVSQDRINLTSHVITSRMILKSRDSREDDPPAFQSITNINIFKELEQNFNCIIFGQSF